MCVHPTDLGRSQFGEELADGAVLVVLLAAHRTGAVAARLAVLLRLRDRAPTVLVLT